MQSSILSALLSTLALSTLTIATPLTPRQRNPATITMRVQTSYGLSPDHTYTNITIPINVLSSLAPCDKNDGNGCALSEITILSVLNTGNLDVSNFECRAYKDIEGLSPGSAPFTFKEPAEVSTNLGIERKVLCYVRTVGEAADDAETK